MLDSYFKHLKKCKGAEGYIVQPDGLVGGNLCKAIKQLALAEQVLHQLLEVLHRGPMLCRGGLGAANSLWSYSTIVRELSQRCV